MKISGASTLNIDVDKLRGTEKRVNRRGGLTIPVALRRMLRVYDGDKFAIYALDNGDIYMKRITGHCMKCGKVTLIKPDEQYIYCDECQNNTEVQKSCENT